MKRIAPLSVILLVAMASSRARAQSRPDPELEVAGGVLLLPVAAAAAFAVGLWAGGGLRSCGGGWDDGPSTPEEEACKVDRDRDQHRGWLIGAGVGAPIAAVGIGLIVHGALRMRRVNSSSFLSGLEVLPQFGRNSYGLLALRRF